MIWVGGSVATLIVVILAVTASIGIAYRTILSRTAVQGMQPIN
jgi:hypothetical protein